MAETTGNPTDGLTLFEATRRMEQKGFGAQFAATEGAAVICYSCHNTTPAVDLKVAEMLRVEGVSDPDDMAAVAGVTCGHCGTQGTLVLKYGPESSPDEAEVLRVL